MILNDVTITYIDGDEDTVSDVMYMDFDERILTLNCTHDLNVDVPMYNIDTITIERRWTEVKTIDDWENDRAEDKETMYKSRIL